MNELERQVMKFALQGEHRALEVLRYQFAEAKVSSRDYTGVGFYTNFAIPEFSPRLPLPRLVIGDVFADMTGLRHGATFLIFIEHGILATLECAIFEDAWPAEARICRLYYLHPKEPGSPSLIETAQRDLPFALGQATELGIDRLDH